MTAVYDTDDRVTRIGDPPLVSERRPLGCQYNYAHSSTRDLLNDFVWRARHCPGMYLPVHWGQVNGVHVGPVGIVCVPESGDRVWFSFYNPGRDDFHARKEHLEDPLCLQVQRLNQGELEPGARNSMVFPLRDNDWNDLIERLDERIFR